MFKISKNNKKKGSKVAETQNNQLSLMLSVVIALLAGASFSLSLAPYGIWSLALISPAILYSLLMSPMSNQRAFIIGEAYGLGYWFVGAFWLYNSIHMYGNVPIVLAILAILIMGLIMGLFHAFIAVVFNSFVSKQPLAFASLWVLQEWLKTWLLTGFPWLFAGYAFTDQPWISSMAPIFGVLGISFVAVLFATSLVEVLRGRVRFIILSFIAVLAGVVLFFLNPAWTQVKDVPDIKVSLIQGNIPQDQKWIKDFQNETLDIYEKLSREEWDSDVVIWPESSIPMFQSKAINFMTGISAIAAETDTTWVVGVPFLDISAFNPTTNTKLPFYNSVMALEEGSTSIYKKQRLVPFGEFIPLSGLFDVFPNLSAGISNFSRGDDRQLPLMVKGQNMGVAICYEVAYPDTTRKNSIGSDFMLTVSNDAWFGTTAGPLQHLQMVQMRAIETGRWFVRSTNNGVTAIINERGQIVKQSPQFERTVLRGSVESRQGQTPYVSYGNKPILLIIALLLLLSVFKLIANKRR